MEISICLLFVPLVLMSFSLPVAFGFTVATLSDCKYLKAVILELLWCKILHHCTLSASVLHLLSYQLLHPLMLHSLLTLISHTISTEKDENILLCKA